MLRPTGDSTEGHTVSNTIVPDKEEVLKKPTPEDSIMAKSKNERKNYDYPTQPQKTGLTNKQIGKAIGKSASQLN